MQLSNQWAQMALGTGGGHDPDPDPSPHPVRTDD